MNGLLEALHTGGYLTPLDMFFAEAMARLVSGASDEVCLGAALASRAIGRGHVCADLARLLAMPLLNADGEAIANVALPSLERWRAALKESALVGDGSTPCPLVLDEGDRLYLYRYADYQRRLAAALLARSDKLEDIDETVLKEGLARLFPEEEGGEKPNRQALAAAMAVQRRFFLISGGPGTGKTTVVAKLLALLQMQALAQSGKPLRIALLAPTGKAAQRLGEAISATVAGLDIDARIRDLIPRMAATIHRGLGYQVRTPTRFRHNAERPLPFDVVLVDEASMVDLALMTKLLDAVPSSARLLLLGDKDQLTSVEAGAILGDIYNEDADHAYSVAFADCVQRLSGEALEAAEGAVPPIADCMIQLCRSYRYDINSGIGALARALNDGDIDRVMEVLSSTEGPAADDTALYALSEEQRLREQIVDGFRPYLEARDPAERLRLFGHFRILCAHRRGRYGVEALNEFVPQQLAAAGLIQPRSSNYDGRPVMITENDYQRELFNGDVGVLCVEEGELFAFFAGPGGETRRISPVQLPPHETAFAMTVHKSQGSELDRVALLLPEQLSPVLSRELIYTAISRAKKRVAIYGSEVVLREASARRVERASGLRSLLWGAHSGSSRP